MKDLVERAIELVKLGDYDAMNWDKCLAAKLYEAAVPEADRKAGHLADAYASTDPLYWALCEHVVNAQPKDLLWPGEEGDDPPRAVSRLAIRAWRSSGRASARGADIALEILERAL